jgi:hypothetical protein
MLAYDPDYLLTRLDIPHSRSANPVDLLNFVDYLAIDSYQDDKPFLCVYGEILPDDHTLANRKPIALISSAMYEKQMPFPVVFYPEHMIMTYKINQSLDRLRPIVIPKDKPFLADVLMGHHKIHRWQLVNRIIQHSLAERCLINIKQGPFSSLDDSKWMQRHFPLFGAIKDIVSPELDALDEPEISRLRSLDVFDSTARIDAFDNSWASRILPLQIYDASWISVVGETNTDNDKFFPTEKTAKPLLDGRLFLAIGGKGHLKNLRNMGFETFHEHIDESYDDHGSQFERVDKMINTLVDLSKDNIQLLYQKILPILMHNQMHARSMRSMTSNLKSFLRGCEIGIRYQPRF